MHIRIGMCMDTCLDGACVAVDRSACSMASCSSLWFADGLWLWPYVVMASTASCSSLWFADGRANGWGTATAVHKDMGWG